MIGEIRPAGRYYGGSGLFGLIWHNFRQRIGQGKDDGLRRHGSDHRWRNSVAFRNPDEGVRSGQCVADQPIELALVRHFGEQPLEMIDVFARLADNAAAIHQNKIPYAESEQEIRDSIAGRPGSDDHDGALLYIFPHHPKSVDESG